jgi:hypothetical protein
MAGRSAWRAAVPRKRQASPTTERMHDLDDVALLQDMRGVAAARDDLAIDLHRDPALGQAFVFEQGGEGGPWRDLAGLAIELDVHAAIVAGSVARNAAVQHEAVRFS